MRASLVMASGTVVSRVLGFAKAIVLALAIGVTASVSADTFALGNLLPNMVYAILIGGVLNAVLVPQIVKATRAEDGGESFINKLVTVGSVILLFITGIAMLLAPVLVWIYALSWTPEQLALATAFAYWCLPQIFFYGLYTLLGEVLNSRSIFGPYTWAPVLNNVVAIAGLVAYIAMFGSDPDGTKALETWTPGAIALLAGSATAGVAAQAFILYFFWRRAGLRFRFNFQWRDLQLLDTGKIAGWSLAMIVILQLSGVVTNNIAAVASGVGVSVAALQYAWLVFMLPHSVLAVSIGTAYFTRFSESASSNNLTTLRADFSASVRVITAVMVLAAGIIFVSAPYIARIIMFGADQSDVAQMAFLLMVYVTCLPAYSFLFVILRGFFALSDAKTPFIITVVLVVLVVAGSLACLLLPKALIGFGLAAVFSAATIVQTVVGAVLYRRRIGGVDGARIVRSLLRFALAVIVAGAVAMAILAIFMLPWQRVTTLESLALLPLVAVVMALVYALVLMITRSPELGLLTRRLRRTPSEAA